MTQLAAALEEPLPVPDDDDESGPHEHLSAGQWVKRHLFPTPVSSVVTVVLGLVALYGFYRLARFLFVTGFWAPVSANLELFMVGTFPREERWRIVAQVLLMCLGGGLMVGSLRGAAVDRAEETGEPRPVTSWRTYLGSYWSIALFVVVLLLAFVRTPGPWLLVGAGIVLAVAGWAATGFLPRSLRAVGWTITALVLVVSFQMLSGTGGWAWFFSMLACYPAVSSLLGRVPDGARAQVTLAGLVLGCAAAVYATVLQTNLLGLIAVLVAAYLVVEYLRGDRLDAAKVGVTMAAGAVISVLYGLIDLTGVDWKDWGGLHLNLVATVAAIALSFPFGLMLALGRRSSLPVVRMLSVAYIEFFRGAPLITFLLAAQFFLGFFLDTRELPSLVTRAIAALTLFTAAYVAEIVRGGLQAVPQGQVEAGLASGLSQAKITRLIVLPQALRAVIPAMVGQFISLFKDTSLLSILALSELLDVRQLVNAQESFRGVGIAEVLTFVCFGFWAFSFAMSRESQRLERRLGVGIR